MLATEKLQFITPASTSTSMSARQVCRLTRRAGKETIETQYAITGVSREPAGASQLLTRWRGHRDIENRLHWVRDTAYREDQCRVCVGTTAHNLESFRISAISLLRLDGVTNITAQLRQNAYQVTQLLAKNELPFCPYKTWNLLVKLSVGSYNLNI